MLLSQWKRHLWWQVICVVFICGVGLWPGCAPTPEKEQSQQEKVNEKNPSDGSEFKGERPPVDATTDALPTDAQPEKQPEKAPEQTPEKAPACDAPFTWPVTKEAVSITASESWKPSIQLPYDSLMHAGNSFEPRWVKFTILLKDPTKVYFQHSRKHLYHHDFVSQHLDPHKGISRADFNKIALHKKDQALAIGAVLVPGETNRYAEYGITFERQDAYHPAMLKILFDLVKSKITTQDPKDPMKAFYFPSFHQKDSAAQLKECLSAKGIEVSSTERWIEGEQCYSVGWAVGRLVQIPGDAIEQAYKNGQLTPKDILLTDAVPAEIPHVAGVISLSPTTPNSHVVILAQTFQVPFAYPRKQLDAVKALAGKEVLLRVRGSGGCQVDIVDMTGKLDSQSRKTLSAYKAAPKIKIPAKQSNGKLHQSTDALTPKDIRYFGGKGANFGLLRKAIPQNSPQSIAFSFDLWDQFMAQKMKSGKTLQEEIIALTKGFTYPPDIAATKRALKEIRDKIKDQTSFTKAQQSAIIAALKPFDAKKKLRFRSSTNVEDSAFFTGAGLYDSYSGCLADDQDDDQKGPSICDATKPKERGIFRAIRKVFASFYNDNAFLERLRFGLDEAKVGMGLLVHHSFPDPDEMANGVATVRKDASGQYRIKLVTQKGASSVTNPDSKAQPEVVTGAKYGTRTGSFYVQQRSSLVPFGTHVLTWKDEYLQLTDLLIKVAGAFEQAHAGVKQYTLDFEYKKMKPGKLIIKQVRQVPQAGVNPSITPFLTGGPLTLCVFQGEYADVFSIHRMKSKWTLVPKHVELNDTGRQSSIFKNIDVTYIHEGARKTRTGSPTNWPGAKHSATDKELADSFTEGSGTKALTIEIRAQIPKQVSALDTRLLLLKDMIWYVKGTHATPVSYIDHNEKVATRTDDFVRLSTNCLDTKVAPGDLLQERTYPGKNGLTVKTSYYWPAAPTGITAGYTAPLIRWVQTEITGLTTQPILLKDDDSQTYRPAHHNFGEWFLFSPALSPNLTKAQKDELKAKDIASIYILGAHRNSTPAIFKYIGFDDKIRDP